MVSRSSIGWLSFMSAFAGVTCGSSDPGPGTQPPIPATVVLSADSVNLLVGAARQLSATVLDQSGSQISGVAVTFTSANATVASVTAGGLLGGQAPGVTSVTAAAAPASTTIPVVVRPAPATAVIASRDVGGCPYGVAVAATGVGYVTQVCGEAVTRFQMSGGVLSGEVAVGSTPAHVAIAPDGGTAYVVNQYGQRLTILNTATNVVIDTVPLGHEGYNVAVAPDGQRVYVTTGDGWVFAVHAGTHAIIDSARAGSGANGLAFHPTAPRLFVSSIHAGTVTAINTGTMAIERTYSVGGLLQRIAVSPSGTTLYAADETFKLDFLNLTTGAVVSRPLAGLAIGLALSPTGDYVYVSLPLLGKVMVVDALSRVIVDSIVTGGDPRNIANAPGGLLVIANQSGWIDFVQ